MFMTRSKIALSLCLALASATVALSAPSPKSIVKLNDGKGSIEFLALVHPSSLRITGKGAAPQGELSLENGNISGTATFKTESFDTGIKSRTDHTNHYLESAKYPNTVLKLTKLPVPSEAGDFSVASAPFEGMLTLHGMEKPVSGTAKINRKGNSIEVVANLVVNTGQFGIEKPKYAGLQMSEDVQVTIRETAPISAAL
jgi:polyisoprenoid-binding protein YceI